MRYGVPYKGSKNQIAEWVCSHFPKATNFYDLFAGGCAITQIALMKSEYRNYFCNDIDFDGILLFMNAIYGKYQNESRWISREDFIVLKNKDPYIKYCWSFGNNGRDYLYSKEIEPYKKAWHYAVFENDFSFAKKLNIDLEPIKELSDIHCKYLISKKIIESVKKKKDCNGLVRQQQLEALNRLQSLQSLQSLQLSNRDYEDVKIDKDSVVFCDIPYINTNCYGKKNVNTFDYKKFYDWCSKQKELVIISEYTMPDDFICIDAIEKSVLLNSGASKKA
ncbi:MAG: DNA adenine methylase, partial [Treponema sp.]|nr:DNA adenine methylase [Treponema sp.]